jgi:addiction module RelE/StbE family toxin
MASVNWTDPALHALDGIQDYLHREAPFYAEHVVGQIFESVDRLEAHPLSGRKVPEAERDDIREVLCKGYRVIYWVVTDDRLDILGVIHGSRDLMNADNQPWNA